MNQFHQKMTVKALDNLAQLTEWEHDFVNSIAEIPEERDLTEKQAHVLNKIVQKIEFG